MKQHFLLPTIGATAVLLMVPGIRSYATAPKWSFLAVAVALAVCFTKVKMTKGHGIGLCFLAWAALSLLRAPVIDDGLQGFAWLSILAGAFMLGAAEKDLRLFFMVTGLAFIPSMLNMAAVRCCGVYFSVGGVFPLGGTFGQPNFAGEAAAAVAASALGMISLRRCPPLIAVGPALATMLLSGSRGGFIGLATMFAVRLMADLKGRAKVVALGVFLACIVGTAYTLTNLQGREASAQRLDIYRDTYDGLTFFGRGIGQYRATVPEKGHRLAARNLNSEHAHNDFLEIAFELGIPGVVLFAWLVATALYGARSDEPAAYAMGSLLVAGLFGFPLYEPVAAFLFAVVAGHLCAVGARVRNELDDRAGSPSPGVPVMAQATADDPTASGGKNLPVGVAVAAGRR